MDYASEEYGKPKKHAPPGETRRSESATPSQKEEQARNKPKEWGSESEAH